MPKRHSVEEKNFVIYRKKKSISFGKNKEVFNAEL